MQPGEINLDSLNDMLSSLSDEDMENISKLASDLFSAEKKEKPSSSFNMGELPFDMNTIMKITSVIKKLSEQPEDPRCRLLQDLKPMLTPQRQNKVDTALQLLKIISVIPFIREITL